MDSEIINKILREVKIGLTDIFGTDLIFGFVCGGFSKGYADKNHDVDVFACLKRKISRKSEERYLRWYFGLHERYGLKPDYNYPGEIMTLKKLIRTLKILKTLKLTLEIKDVPTKKAIIWADMITGRTKAETGFDLELFHILKRKYKKYPNQWKREILSLIPEKSKAVWRRKNHLLIMEHFMKYPKHDGKKLEKYFNKKG